MTIDAMKTPGAFSWNELMTSDIEAAKGFYGELFGWQFEEAKDSPIPYHFAKIGDTEVAGIMFNETEEAGTTPPMWGPYVTVSNVDECASRVWDMEGKVIVGPKDIPNVGRFAVIQDPQGAVMSVITYAENSAS